MAVSCDMVHLQAPKASSLASDQWQWRLACVEQLIMGRDGVVPAAHLRLTNGNQLNRPLQKLFPLEVSANQEQHGNENDKVTSAKGEPRGNQGLTRPLRVSAQNALKKIKEQTALLDQL